MISPMLAAGDASTAPAWLHLTVIIVAVFVLAYSLTRHSG